MGRGPKWSRDQLEDAARLFEAGVGPFEMVNLRPHWPLSTVKKLHVKLKRDMPPRSRRHHYGGTVLVCRCSSRFGGVLGQESRGVYRRGGKTHASSLNSIVIWLCSQPPTVDTLSELRTRREPSPVVSRAWRHASGQRAHAQSLHALQLCGEPFSGEGLTRHEQQFVADVTDSAIAG